MRTQHEAQRLTRVFASPAADGDHVRKHPACRVVRRLVPAGVAALVAAVAVLPVTALAFQAHTVASGDTLSGIAERYGVPLADIIALNGIADPDRILAGQVIRFEPAASPPAQPRTYVVRAGDTLSRIAAQFGVSPADLVAANGLADPDHILVGQALSIGPISAAGAPAPLTHRIRAGESLAAIAAAHGITVGALAAANDIQDVNHIVAGAILTIPLPDTATGSAAVRELLEAAAAEFGVDPALVLAIAWQESGWNQSMVSTAGAIGVMQVTPETGDWAAADLIGGAFNWRTSARDNARVGVAVLHNLLLATDGDVALALAGYYQGLRSVRTVGLFEDTKAYIDNVLALAERWK